MMTEPARWYQVETTVEGMVVRFLPCPDPEWQPAVLGERPLVGNFAGKQVLLEGKAPLWMYAHVAIAARRGGATAIDVYQPHNISLIRVFPLAESTSVDPGWLRHQRDATGGGLLEFQRPQEGELWEPECLGSLLHAAKEWETDLLTMTGPAPNWLSAAVACLADACAGRLVAYYAPRDGCGILLNATPGQKVEMLPSPLFSTTEGQKGHVIGILGDPNSGKSVLSILLEKGFDTAGTGSHWRLDCDHAAPTPHWYLQMAGQNREEQADTLRDGQKREWTTEAEISLARQLRHCAASLQWVIADFPGGIHKFPPVKRIPPGREVLLREADSFVILTRRDNFASVAGWREELARFGLESRIIAVVESVDYMAPINLAFREDELIHAEVDGLRRENLSSLTLGAKLDPWADLARLMVKRIQGSYR